ncbi:MAG: AAA family ATPase [Planctomycetes bacterium]|nr:AAA family ATPase [Planctomycetota bacterium]
MIVRRLTARGFMRFEDLDLRGLPREGRIAILGPNESGKSTLGEAISFALFGRTRQWDAAEGARSGAGPDRVIHWDKDRCEVTLDFEVPDRGEYRVYRELDRRGTNYATLQRVETGETVANGNAQVAAAMEEIAGIGYDEFRHSFYLAQDDIDLGPAAADDAAGVAGAGGGIVDRILGVDRLEAIRGRAGVALEGLREEVRGLDEAVRLQDALLREARVDEGLGPSLEVGLAALGEEADAAGSAAAVLDDAALALEGFAGRAEGLRLRLAPLESTEELGRARDALPGLEEAFGPAPAGGGARVGAFLAATEARRSPVRDGLAALRRCIESVEALAVAARARGRAIDDDLAPAGPVATSKAAAQAAAEAEAAARLADASSRRRWGRVAAVLALVLAAGAFLLDPWAAGLDRWIAEVFEWRTDLAGVADRLLAGRLPARWGSFVLSREGLFVLDAAVSGTLWVLTFMAASAARRLRREAASATARARGLEVQVGELIAERRRALEMDASTVGSALHALETLRGVATRSALEGFRGANARFLGGLAASGVLREASLAAAGERDDARAEAGRARAEAAAHRECLAAAQRKLEALTEERAHWREEVARVADLRSGLGSRMARLREAQQAVAVHVALVEAAAETVARVRGRFGPAVARFLKQILPRVTLGRYRNVQVGDDLRVRVFSPDRNAFVGLEELSGGTRDQVWLCVRLAFSEALLLTRGRQGVPAQFLFLDEPLNAFDPDRAQGFLELVRDLRRSFGQVFLASQVERVVRGADITLRTDLETRVLRFGGTDGEAAEAGARETHARRPPGREAAEGPAAGPLPVAESSG